MNENFLTPKQQKFLDNLIVEKENSEKEAMVAGYLTSLLSVKEFLKQKNDNGIEITYGELGNYIDTLAGGSEMIIENLYNEQIKNR